MDYDAIEAVSVQEAVAWANEQRSPVTLYLYDVNGGFESGKHFNEMEGRFPNGDAE